MSTKARILEHTVGILSDIDAQSLTMRDIAGDLSISSGSLFHAFPNKQALLAACFAEGIRRYHDQAIEALEQGGEPVGALRAFIAAHLFWVEGNAGLARFLFSPLPTGVNKEAKALAASTNRRFVDALGNLFSSLASEGAMADVCSQLAHSLAIGPSQEYCRKWLRNATETKPSGLIDVFQTAAVAALAATNPPVPAETPVPARQPTPAESPGIPILTNQSVVYPWHCDHMGHMNVMWYTSKFDEATWRFFAELGMTSKWFAENDRGMAAIEQTTKYLSELNAGDVIEINTRLLESHEKVLVFEHEMVDAVGGRVAATSKITGVHLDTVARRSTSFAAQVMEAASQLLVPGSALL
ncbi:MAG: thioesterase family protein [Actinomycetota bacterium]|nr:thioesterase family protein [Actinomycetota bacterium]